MREDYSPKFKTAVAIRAAIRAGQFDGPTAGEAPGFAQANVVILPNRFAESFLQFCLLNSQACPLIGRSLPGQFELADLASGSDIRTDVPRYRVFKKGQPLATEPAEIADLWRNDFVTFLLGCSFTFERALQTAGFRVRHLDQNRNVPMFRTSIPTQAAGDFSGPMVVSMRPFPATQIAAVTEITGRFSRTHGAPIVSAHQDQG